MRLASVLLLVAASGYSQQAIQTPRQALQVVRTEYQNGQILVHLKNVTTKLVTAYAVELDVTSGTERKVATTITDLLPSIAALEAAGPTEKYSPGFVPGIAAGQTHIATYAPPVQNPTKINAHATSVVFANGLILGDAKPMQPTFDSRQAQMTVYCEAAPVLRRISTEPGTMRETLHNLSQKMQVSEVSTGTGSTDFARLNKERALIQEQKNLGEALTGVERAIFNPTVSMEKRQDYIVAYTKYVSKRCDVTTSNANKTEVSDVR